MRSSEAFIAASRRFREEPRAAVLLAFVSQQSIRFELFEVGGAALVCEILVIDLIQFPPEHPSHDFRPKWVVGRRGYADLIPDRMQHFGENSVDHRECRRNFFRDIDVFHGAKWKT